MRGARYALVGLAAALLIACTSAPRREPAAGSGAGADAPVTGGSAGTLDSTAGSGGALAEPVPDAALEIDATIVTEDAGLDAEPPAVEDDAAVDAAIDAGQPMPVYSTHRSGAAVFELRIDKLVRERNYCVQLAIAWPHTPDEPDEIDVPAPWNLYYAWAIDGIATNEECRDSLGGDGKHNVQQALSARGRIAVHDPGQADAAPCSIDVDVEVTFMGSDQIPTTDRLIATDLPVECEYF